MAVQTSTNLGNHLYDSDDDDDDNQPNQTNEYDEEIDETEGDLIENYLYLTQRCGVLRHSPTTSALATIQQQQIHQQNLPNVLGRQMSLAIDDHHGEFERSLHHLRPRASLNDFTNPHHLHHHSEHSRVPPNIYYSNRDDDDYDERSFSLVKLFARMKQRLKHDRRYRARSTHELLHEEDSQEWYELTKNTRSILTKALLPDGGYDALVRQNKPSHSRRNSQKKPRDCDPVLSQVIEDDEDKINLSIDVALNTEGDVVFDEVIWQNFVKCARGFDYRRGGVCKAIDRQQFQGQLVYVYGVANNILIDENLKASGLG
ncbi:unnamed protein product [Adineta ricciae]|uniref:Uncharacterized protein n=1 Tax=Adineta ricciae TaxID=249248 RepID=A0A813MT63_ADIRI|nr:unnamed protein product [Adineta ricciae]CAF0853131.1 unnamed protein product [Adineta ricciae]